MRISKLIGSRLKKVPETQLIWEEYLLRGAFYRRYDENFSGGLNPLIRVQKKIEKVFAKVFEDTDFQEIRLAVSDMDNWPFPQNTHEYHLRGDWIFSGILADELRSYRQIPLCAWSLLSHIKVEGKSPGFGGEIQGPCPGFGGEIQGPCPGFGGEIQGPCPGFGREIQGPCPSSGPFPPGDSSPPSSLYSLSPGSSSIHSLGSKNLPGFGRDMRDGAAHDYLWGAMIDTGPDHHILSSTPRKMIEGALNIAGFSETEIVKISHLPAQQDIEETTILAYAQAPEIADLVEGNKKNPSAGPKGKNKKNLSANTTRKDERDGIISFYHCPQCKKDMALSAIGSYGKGDGAISGIQANCKENMELSNAGSDNEENLAISGIQANCKKMEEKNDEKGQKFHINPHLSEKLTQIHTPDASTISELCKLLNISPEKTAKVIFYEEDSGKKPVIALIRGDLEANEDKIGRIIGASPRPARLETIAKIGAIPGFASPLGLKEGTFSLIVDLSLKGPELFITGANKKDWHIGDFNPERDIENCPFFDIANPENDGFCPHCLSKLEMKNARELARINVWEQGKYQRGNLIVDGADLIIPARLITFLIENDQILKALIEKNADSYGPRFPLNIAPWEIHISLLDTDKNQVSTTGEWLYKELQAAGLETIFDDRGERPGAQFAEGDLLGVPYRFIVSEKTVEQNSVEFKRIGEKSVLVPIEEAIEIASERIIQELNNIE